VKRIRPSDPLSRMRVRRSASVYRKDLRAEMISVYGAQCACCSITIPEFLTLEHRNLDGAAHRAAVGRNAQAQILDLKTRGWPRDGYTLLCFNCNLASYHHGSCPHTWPNGVKPCPYPNESSAFDGATDCSGATDAMGE
jgi:hypothetical protein